MGLQTIRLALNSIYALTSSAAASQIYRFLYQILDSPIIYIIYNLRRREMDNAQTDAK